MKQRMKTAVWCVLLLFLVGCGSSSPQVSGDAPFSCCMMAEQDGVEWIGNFSRTLIGCYEWEITSPREWAGLTFSCQDATTTLSFGEVTLPLQGELPASSYFGGAVGILDHFARAGEPEPVYWDEQTVVYKGEWEATPYTLTFDRETKKPAALVLDDRLTLSFFEYH